MGFRKLNAAILVTILSACGRKAPAPAPEAPFTANSAEEAITHLSQADRAAFDAWAKRLDKNCTTDAIFSEESSETPSPLLDAHILAARAPEGVISDESGRFVILGTGEAPLGESKSVLNRSATVNGRHYTLAAETQRQGGKCTVSLYGQTVFETKLYETVRVVGGMRERPSGEEITSKPELITAPVGGYAQLREHQLPNLLAKQLAPGAWVKTYVAERLGLTEPYVAQTFPLGSVDAFLRSSHAYDFRGTNSENALLPWRNGETASILGSNEAVTALLAAPEFTFTGYFRAGSEPEAKLRTIQFKVRSRTVESDARLRRYSLVSAKLLPATSPSDETATACYRKRLAALQAFESGTTGSYRIPAPEYDVVSTACDAYAGDFTEALLGAEDIRKGIGALFSRVQASSSTDYRGWNFALTRMVLKLQARGAAIKESFLDANQNSGILTQIESLLALINQQATARPSLAPLKPDLFETAFAWSFTGNAPEAAKTQEMLIALAHAADPFATSTRTLLSNLRAAPFDHDEELAFAKGLSEAYKARGRRGTELAQALGLSDPFARVLQDKVPQAAIENAVELHEAAHAFATRDRARNTKDSFGFASDLHSVVEKGVKESWRNATYEELERVAPIARFQTMCERYETVSELADCVSLSDFSVAPKGILSPAAAGRYGRLAARYEALFPLLVPPSSFYTLRYDLAHPFFEPVWSACSNEEFDRRTVALDEKVRAAARETNTSKRWELERQIAELLRGGC